MTSHLDALKALRAADQAGNVGDARRLARIVDKLSKGPQAGDDGAPVVSSPAYSRRFGLSSPFTKPRTTRLEKPPLEAVIGGGFNRGLTGVVDMVGAGLNLIPGVDIDEPVGGTKFMKKVAPALFPERTDTPAGRVVGRVGQELGATVLPASGILRVARGVPTAVKAGASLMERAGKAFIDPIRRTPGAAAVGETVAAAAAGGGAGLAQEAFPGDQNAELVGQILGGLTPAVLANMPAALAVKAANKAMKKYAPEAAAKEGKRQANKLLADELTTEAKRRLAEADVLRADIPGFNPSLGEATGSPSLIATQRQLETAAKGGELETLAARRANSEQAVDRFAETQAPQATEGPDFVVDAANKQVSDLRAAVDVEDAKVGVRRGAVADRLPVANRPAGGETIRSGIQDAREAARTRMNTLSDELGINAEDVTAPFDAWRKAVLKEVRPASEFSDTIGYSAVKKALTRTQKKTPSAPASSILDSSGVPFRPPGAPKAATFQDVKAVRERLSDAILDEIGSAKPSRKKLRSLIIAKKRMDGFIEGLAKNDVSGRYEKFRKAYFNEFIKPFESGTVYKVRQRNGRGFYKTSDEKVADAFWQSGNVSAARQYKAVLGGDPGANAAIKSSALDSLRDAAVRDGVVQPKLFAAWTRKYRSVLDEFPDIKSAVDDVGNANQALVTRQGELNTQRQLIEDQIFTRELRAFAGGGKTSEQVIGAALKDPRKMSQLVGKLKVKGAPPEALEALRRNIWDQALQGDDMTGFLADNQAALSRLFKKSHLRDLEKIADARAMHARVPPPKGAGARPRPLEDVEKLIGQGIPQVGSRVFAFKSGRMQRGYLVIDTLMRAWRGRAVAAAEDAFRVALYDADMAREMAGVLDLGSVTQETANRLRARAFALLPTLVEEESED